MENNFSRSFQTRIALRTFVLLATLLPSAALACATTETETNDRDTQASGPLCPGTSASGSIASTTDADWFYVELAGPGSLTVELTHERANDFDFALYGATGGALLRASSSSVPERATLAIGAAGRYFVKVTRYAGTGSYQLALNFATAGNGGGGNTGGDSGSGTASCSYGARPARPAELTTYLLGAASDRCVSPAGPLLLMMGGGYEVDEAFENRAKSVIAGGDVVVLRTSSSDAYNDYLQPLLAADSVETLVVDSVAKANSAYVSWAIRSAELVWIAGGDQTEYLTLWDGTLVESALDHVYREKKGVVGGTSAGMAVLSDFIYRPAGASSVTSSQATSDPCQSDVQLATGFTPFAPLAGSIADTHFVTRDRFGRLLAFMARMGTPFRTPARPIRGIGIDEDTALTIYASGYAIVDGDGDAYVLRETPSTERAQVRCGSPLIYRGLSRYRLSAGDWYDFTKDTSSVTPVSVSVDGAASSRYMPSSPY